MITLYNSPIKVRVRLFRIETDAGMTKALGPAASHKYDLVLFKDESNEH